MTRQQQYKCVKTQIDLQNPAPTSANNKSEMDDHSQASERQPGQETDDCSGNDSKQLAVANCVTKIYDFNLPNGSGKYAENEDGDDDGDEPTNRSLIDHAWSRKILELIGNKAKLLESFSWLSTVGGGFSALGERDSKFSARAGALSLGQQLRLAELLGDERLKVMCHLFGALAALQLNNKQFCLNYIKRVIIPLINAMPYHDPILTNILRHICFRMSMMDNFAAARYNAIENNKEDMDQLETQRNTETTR